jgi:hypothetical protein
MASKACVIVASGPSAKGFVAPDNVTVIAVNGAIEWLNRADYAFTLDPSKVNMARLKNRRPGVKYAVALPPDFRAVKDVVRYKRVAYRGREPADKSSVDWWFWRLSCVKTLCIKKDSIHTGNSSWGALGLAFHLGFKNVALIGVDGTSDKKVDGGGSGNLSHLSMLFESALPQINVVSCGMLSSIPQMSFQDWLCMYSPS